MFPFRKRASPNGSCSNDYIQSWLEKTQQRPAWEPLADDSRVDEVPWRPHSLGAVDTENPSHRSRLREHRRKSSDSSIIPDPRLSHTVRSRRHLTEREECDRRKRRRRQRNASMSPAPKKHDAGPFKKRARHKTRPDRYETRKIKSVNDGKGGNGGKKAKRTKTLGPKKLDLPNREVMDNFTSNAILAKGRLTVSNILECSFSLLTSLFSVTGKAAFYVRAV